MQKEWDWKGGGRKQDIKTFKGARFLRLSWGAGIRLYLVYPCKRWCSFHIYYFIRAKEVFL